MTSGPCSPWVFADATHVYPTGDDLISPVFSTESTLHKRARAEARPANPAGPRPVEGSAASPAHSDMARLRSGRATGGCIRPLISPRSGTRWSMRFRGSIGFYVGGRSLAEKEAALIGWAAWPHRGEYAPELRDRGGRGHVEDHGLHVWSSRGEPAGRLRLMRYASYRAPVSGRAGSGRPARCRLDRPAHLNGDLEVLNFERAKPNSLKAG